MKIPSALPVDIETAVHSFIDQESIVAVTDRAGSIVYANDRFCEISGYSREELLGRNHRLLKSGVHPAEFYRQLWQCITAGEIWRGEVCNRAKDGHLYWVETAICPLREQGFTRYYLSLRTDITAMKQAEEALAQKRQCDEEERRLMALGQLADGALHDLDNILTGILGLSSIRDAETRSSLLQQSVDELIRLTRTFRDLSPGKRSTPVRFTLNPLLLGVCTLSRVNKTGARRLRLSTNFEASAGCDIVGYEAQIFEVMTSLVTNASEACATSPMPMISLGTRLIRDSVVIHVEDNGPGIPKEQLPFLFVPIRSAKGSSRGLGLCNARSIALAHGGDLRLADAGGEGKGARFELEIPIETLTSSTTEPPTPTHKERSCLLVCESDAFVRRVIETAAMQEGLDLVFAEEGDLFRVAEAKKKLLTAIVLDARDIDSEHGVVARLRRLSPKLPLLVTSAQLSGSSLRDMRWMGIHRLQKPFDTFAFVEALGRIDAKRSPANRV